MIKLRFVSVVTAVVLASGAAFAQPGPDQPAGPYVPPAYAYQPAQPPTAEDQADLDRGPISSAQIVGGGVASIFLGFGIGQAIEGRWHHRGWIFTLGETLTAAGMISGLSMALDANCPGWGDGICDAGENSTGVGLALVSAIAFGGLRVWEIADAFVAPVGYNEHVDELRRKYGYREPIYTRITPYIARPQASDSGMTAGLALRF